MACAAFCAASAAATSAAFAFAAGDIVRVEGLRGPGPVPRSLNGQQFVLQEATAVAAGPPGAQRLVVLLAAPSPPQPLPRTYGGFVELVVHVPKGAGPFPVVLVFHGGGFTAGGRAEIKISRPLRFDVF